MALKDRLNYLSQGIQSMSQVDILDDWKAATEDLFQLVENFVRPFVHENLLSIDRELINITEENLGSYVAPKLVLHSGPVNVVFQPVARLTAGSTGRIDVSSSRSEVGYSLLRHGIGVEATWDVMPKINRLAALADVIPAFENALNPRPRFIKFNTAELEKILDKLFAA